MLTLVKAPDPIINWYMIIHLIIALLLCGDSIFRIIKFRKSKNKSLISPVEIATGLFLLFSWTVMTISEQYVLLIVPEIPDYLQC